MGNVLRRRATELMQNGIPEQEIVQQIDQLRISSAQQAAVDLRLFFILGKLAEQFGIEVTREEVNARIASIAMQYGRRPEKLKSQIGRLRPARTAPPADSRQKVVDKLVELLQLAAGGHLALELLGPPAVLRDRREACVYFLRRDLNAELLASLLMMKNSRRSTAACAEEMRLFFIMSKLAEQFSIEVSPEEVNAHLASIAMQYGRRPEKLKSQMSASGQLEQLHQLIHDLHVANLQVELLQLAAGGQLEQLHLQIRDMKVVDKLVEMGQVSDVDEKTLAEEFKNLPPLSNIGPIVTGVSHSAKPEEKPEEPKAEESKAEESKPEPKGKGGAKKKK